MLLWCGENAITERLVCVGIICNGYFIRLEQVVFQVPVVVISLIRSFTAGFLHAARSKKARSAVSRG